MRTKTLIIIILLGFHHSIAQNEKVDYSNPALIMGSSWGNVFHRFYIDGDYEEMLTLTSAYPIDRYGRVLTIKH